MITLVRLAKVMADCTCSGNRRDRVAYRHDSRLGRFPTYRNLVNSAPLSQGVRMGHHFPVSQRNAIHGRQKSGPSTHHLDLDNRRIDSCKAS